MDFEQDYIMRLIKQMVAALISVLLGKENKTYELPLEDQYKSSEGLLRELLTMVNDGKINEAENLLYERLEQEERKKIYVITELGKQAVRREIERLKQSYLLGKELMDGGYGDEDI